jgi:hypothetical protein
MVCSQIQQTCLGIITITWAINHLQDNNFDKDNSFFPSIAKPEDLPTQDLYTRNQNKLQSRNIRIKNGNLTPIPRSAKFETTSQLSTRHDRIMLQLADI